MYIPQITQSEQSDGHSVGAGQSYNRGGQNGGGFNNYNNGASNFGSQFGQGGASQQGILI